MTASIRYSAQTPPIALMVAADLYALSATRHAAHAAPEQQRVHMSFLPMAGVSTPEMTMPDGSIVVGAPYILRYLARLGSSVSLSLYGAEAAQSVQIDYFLDLAALVSNKDTLSKYAEMINNHLQHNTVLVGEALSIADLYVWEQIVANTRWAHFSKTSAAQFPHLFRWVNMVQNHPVVMSALSVKQNVEKRKAEARMARSAEGAGFDVDLPGAVMGEVVTRFPPEPSGYLHIGHVKAAMLNDAISKKYKGKLILRFDDTNPQKEKDEYVQNIMDDLKRIGVEHHLLTHTSDYFDLIQDYAERMLKEGKAYIDNTPVEQMRAWRMDGVESPSRNQPVEENLRLWREMLAGSDEGKACCMRAKIDMQAKNKAMRDPTIYRVNMAAPHHRTGTKYKAYPTYDLACPIVDSIEGVTHTLRTNEYRDRNEQYYWMIDALGLRKPFIRDYSRLNFVYTVLSKRKLQWFVDSKKVEGWTDPRFPTVQGILRRGMTVEALREFILGQGFSMSTNMMEWDKIWTINKRVIDPVAHRYTALSAANQAVLELDNVPASSATELVKVDLHPKNPSIGTKIVTRSNRVLLEQDDARLVKDGEEVTLMNWGNVIVHKVHWEGQLVTKLEGSLNLGGDPKKTEKKLTWLDGAAAQQADQVPVTFVELDTLVTVPKVEEGVEFESIVNPTTRFETPGVGEPAMRNLQKSQIIQVSRRGFFIVDALGTADQPMQLILIPDGKMKAMSTLSTKVDKSKGFQGR